MPVRTGKVGRPANTWEDALDTLERLFEESTTERGPNECWPCSRRVFDVKTPDGKLAMTAMRYSFELAGGEVPKGRNVKRSRACALVNCVNPAHLYVYEEPSKVSDADRERIKEVLSRPIIPPRPE